MFILFFIFSLSFRQPDQQPRIVPASALFLLLTEGFRPLPSSCLFIASFQCSLRRFLFGKRLQRYNLCFKPPNFSRTFFQVSFPEPRVRPGPTPSGITLKLHDHRSVSLLRLQRYCLFPFPPNFSASFFAPFFNFFHNILILRHLFRKLFSPRFPSFATETSPNYLHTLLYI